MSKAIYELDIVKVKREAVAVVREAIKGGYYKLDTPTAKYKALKEISKKICEVYDVKEPTNIIVGKKPNSYYPDTGEIYIENYSIISYLHELRHHMQRVKGLKYRGLTIEQDSRAFSMRIYYLAVPKMFVQAVKDNKVLHVKYDEEIGRAHV